MHPNRLVGTLRVRVAALVCAAMCVSTVILYTSDAGLGRGLILFVAIASGALGFGGLIFSFQSLYARWMKFSTLLHSILVTILFGVCYLLLVPLFMIAVWPSDPLQLRVRSKASSFWIRRRSIEFEPDALLRMG